MCLNFERDPLHDLVPFVQFKKHETNPWTNVKFNKMQAKTTKSNTLPYLFFMFLNCKNGIKSRKVSQPYINLNNLLLLHSYILNIYLCTRAA